LERILNENNIIHNYNLDILLHDYVYGIDYGKDKLDESDKLKVLIRFVSIDIDPMLQDVAEWLDEVKII
jgi:hypothetical protein